MNKSNLLSSFQVRSSLLGYRSDTDKKIMHNPASVNNKTKDILSKKIKNNNNNNKKNYSPNKSA